MRCFMHNKLFSSKVNGARIECDNAQRELTRTR